MARQLDRSADDPAFTARAVALPSAGFLAQAMEVIDVDGIAAALRFLRRDLGHELAAAWLATYEASRDRGEYSIEPAAIGRRALKNACLGWLAWGGEGAGLGLDQYRSADNMTDRLAALRIACDVGLADRDALLDDFYAAWKHEPLVVNKWLSLQASTESDDAPERIVALTRHPAFTMSNPNRVRAVFGAFAMSNMMGFHRRDGAGYRIIADAVIELDRRNPPIAARLLTSLGRWRRFDPARKQLMKAELERIVATTGLSKDCYEIASKSLA